MKFPECREQAFPKREAKAEATSFMERRPFRLKRELCYKKNVMRLIRLFLLVLFILSVMPMTAQAQTPTPPAAIRLVLDSMTPEERVGQLFLVSFTGTDTGPESQIYDLVVQRHVGGVVLAGKNDNFTGDDYRRLFPKEWRGASKVKDTGTIAAKAQRFWQGPVKNC